MLAAAAFLLGAAGADMVVAGATPAGIAAALNAARYGRSVALIEPSSRIGGMLTNGLSYTDFRSPQAVQGTFRDYMELVEAHYQQTYGPDSAQVKECYFWAHAEPKVSLLVLERMLARYQSIRIFRRYSVREATVTAGPGGKQIRAVSVAGPDGQVTVMEARVFIDATYEGDLAARAGAEYRVGRESTREFGERLAGHIFFKQGVLLPGGTGEGDKRIQCYNFRVTMTDRAENAVLVPRPPDYNRSDYASVLPHFTSGRLKRIFTTGHDGIFRVQRISNGKADINDINVSPIGFGLPGENYEYPEGDAATRRRIYDRHRNYAMGLLYFLRTDPEVPQSIRSEAAQWGLARDEFVESGHFPAQLYVREARRVMGEYLFQESDVEIAQGGVRTRLQPESIAISDYPINSHGSQKAGPLYPDVREGYVVYGLVPFQIPYGVMVARGFTNLLTPVPASSTHIGFCALRYEATWTAMGQAAGSAAHLAIQSGKELRSVPVAALQSLLHAAGAATIYVSDVPRTSPLFAKVQRLGTLGFFHEPVDLSKVVLESRKLRYGIQYFDPPGYHDARLEEPLLPETLKYWAGLLRKAGIQAPPTRAAITRGEFIRSIELPASGSN